MKNNRIILIEVILSVLVCVCAAVVNISYMVWKQNNNDPQAEPIACPACGSEYHVMHPVDKSCEVCGSPFHYTAEHETENPTCPQCGSTDHITHPSDGEIMKE